MQEKKMEDNLFKMPMFLWWSIKIYISKLFSSKTFLHIIISMYIHIAHINEKMHYSKHSKLLYNLASVQLLFLNAT